tara:strand:- start:10714 stop:11166 length:453 start_codon:yes stop_codon:yes gene_type:complete
MTNNLEQFKGDLGTINTLNYTGLLTTITEDGMPRVGSSAKTGNSYANGIKFVLDGGNKQANLLAVAYGDNLIKKIVQTLSNAPVSSVTNKPFIRVGVTGKLQNNNYEDKEGVMHYKTEMVITDIWEAPVKNETFGYENPVVDNSASEEQE